MEHCELLIVGAGAAGLAAAEGAWSAGCRDIVVADRASRPGGILPQCVHRGFGLSTFGQELTGPEYAARIMERLNATGVRLLMETEVLSVTKERRAVLSWRVGLAEYGFDKLILAAGCRERAIGSLPVAGTRPAGVFTAGQAQELINLRHQELADHVLIMGSGDLGMIMARRFTLEGLSVDALIEQERHYGGMARNYHRCILPYSIPILYRTTVTEIHGEGRIRGVTLLNLDSGAREYVPCGTLITALGIIPERELLRGLGNPDWLFLAGNCSRVHDIVDSAVAEAEAVGKKAAGR